MTEAWQIVLIPLGLAGLWLLYYVWQGFIKGFRSGGELAQKYTYTNENEPGTINPKINWSSKVVNAGDKYNDAVAALISLGYKRSSAKAAVSIASRELNNPTTESLVKAALGKASQGGQ